MIIMCLNPFFACDPGKFLNHLENGAFWDWVNASKKVEMAFSKPAQGPSRIPKKVFLGHAFGTPTKTSQCRECNAKVVCEALYNTQGLCVCVFCVDCVLGRVVK